MQILTEQETNQFKDMIMGLLVGVAFPHPGPLPLSKSVGQLSSSVQSYCENLSLLHTSDAFSGSRDRSGDRSVNGLFPSMTEASTPEEKVVASL